MHTLQSEFVSRQLVGGENDESSDDQRMMPQRLQARANGGRLMFNAHHPPGEHTHTPTHIHTPSTHTHTYTPTHTRTHTHRSSNRWCAHTTAASRREPNAKANVLL